MALDNNYNGLTKLKDWWGKVKGNFQYLDGKIDSNFEQLDNRISTIITTPVEGVSAQEIIDARKGELALGDKIDAMDLEVSTHLAETANYCHFALTNTQSIALESFIAILFDKTVEANTDLFTLNADGSVTIKKTGSYEIESCFNWAANQYGRRILAVYKNNGSENYITQIDTQAGFAYSSDTNLQPKTVRLQGRWLLKFNANEKIIIKAYHESRNTSGAGGSLDITASDHITYLKVRKVS